MRKRVSQRSYQKICVPDRSLCTESNIIDNLTKNFDKNRFITATVNQKCTIIFTLLDKTVNDLIGKRYVTVMYSKKWYTPELRQMKREERNLQMIAQIFDTSETWLAFKRKRNEYNRKLRDAQNGEIKNILETCENDPKKLWKEMKRMYNNSAPLPDYIDFDGLKLCDSYFIAKNFNRFFINSIKEINESIPFVNYDNDITEMCQQTLSEFTLTNEREVNIILKKNSKKKSGVNNVNSEIVQFGMKVLSSEIVTLFNESLRSGIFPDQLKFTVVTPIPKVVRTDLSNEFRPINNAHPLDKVLQTIVKQQLEQHIHRNNILTEVQSAFRGQHSCETALNLILLRWKEARMQRKVVLAVFLDFKRAFETVDRQILCWVLEKYGVNGTVLAWFKSWLTNRRQLTKFKDAVSEELTNSIGIPQGTPLSCILFILYINDMSRKVKDSYINLFADDTLMWIEHESISVAIELMNQDLERISNYLKSVKLKLNVNKTKYMVIGNGGNTENAVTIDGNSILETRIIKYLGVMIDSDLNFEANVDYVVKKMSKKIGFLGRNKNKMNKQTRLLYYNAVIAPHVDYCSSILFLASETQIEKLQKQQNKALRLITNGNRRTHIHTMLNDTKLLDIKQRIYFNVLILMFKASKNLLPEYLCKHLNRVRDLQPYSLRQNNLLRPPSYRTADAQNSFLYKGVQVFNNMMGQPNTSVTTVNQFKNAAEKFVKSTVSSHRIL